MLKDIFWQAFILLGQCQQNGQYVWTVAMCGSGFEQSQMSGHTAAAATGAEDMEKIVLLCVLKEMMITRVYNWSTIS